MIEYFKKSISLIVAITGLALIANLAAHLFGTAHFKKFSDGVSINSTWKASVEPLTRKPGVSLQPHFAYSIKSATGKTVEIEQLEFDDLHFVYLEKNGKDFLLTRYYGTGSSEAYYYSLYRLSESTAEPVFATEYQDFQREDGADGCLKSLEVRKLDKPLRVFGSCGDPDISKENLVFELPGWHCGLFEEGGCPDRTTVSLR